MMGIPLTKSIENLTRVYRLAASRMNSNLSGTMTRDFRLIISPEKGQEYQAIRFFGKNIRFRVSTGRNS
jgi:hypothetical protein